MKWRNSAVRTRVLVSTTNTNSDLTVLRSQAPRAVGTQEFIAFAPSATALAERREHARKMPSPTKLSSQFDGVTRALTRLERRLIRDDRPWFAAMQAGDHHVAAL